MKKITVLFLFSILLASCTQTKIGYIDVEEVMKEYDATKLMEKQIAAEQEEMAKVLDSLSIPFQSKVAAFNKNAKNLSESKRTAQIEALQQEQQMLQARQQQAQQIMQQRGVEEIEKLTKKVDSVVEAYAIANKYQMILGTQGKGTVMYGEDQINLSETIIDILNAEFEKTASN